jgi:hypothetical protein
LNDAALSLNQEFTNKVYDEIPPSEFDRVVNSLDGLNRSVHDLNQYHNLSARSERQIPNLGSRIQQVVPAEYGIYSSYEEAQSYEYFDPRLVFGEDL